MRVALVTSNYPPEFVGGTERVVQSLGLALRRRGDEVVIVSGSEQPHAGTDVLREQHDGIRVLRIPRRSDESYGLDVTRPRIRDVIVRELLEERVECLHVHHWSALSSALLRAAATAGIRGVATLHDLFTTCPRFFRRPPAGIACPSGAGRAACVPCVRLGLPHLDEASAVRGLAARDHDLRAELAAARVITVPSEACRRRIAAHVPWPGAIEVVPHGLLEPVGTHAPEARRGDVLRVGSFGNLVEEKGVLLLVWACRGIEGLELHLEGRFLDAAFEKLVRDKATEFGVDLVCHGAYRREDPHPARRLDVAVFPSLCEETYGLVVEEALARGVPVVVSDRGALSERIGGGGIAVSVDEVAPLAELLRLLVREPSRLAALRAGIPRRFATMTDAADRYRELYALALTTSAMGSRPC